MYYVLFCLVGTNLTRGTLVHPHHHQHYIISLDQPFLLSLEHNLPCNNSIEHWPNVLAPLLSKEEGRSQEGRSHPGCAGKRKGRDRTQETRRQMTERRRGGDGDPFVMSSFFFSVCVNCRPRIYYYNLFARAFQPLQHLLFSEGRK